MIVDEQFGTFNKKKEEIYYNKEKNLYIITDLTKLSRKALGFSPTDGFTKKDANGNLLYFVYGKNKNKNKNKSSGFFIKLSDIMEDDVDEKYYLKEEQVNRLMNRK